MKAPRSRCSGGRPLVFIWADRRSPQSHIDTAVDSLMTAISGSGRRWNPWTRSMTRAEFRNRLEAAEHGDLEPVDEVKPLTRGASTWLYEIRWQDIAVHTVDATGTESYGTVGARLLHAEPPHFPRHLLGLHVHEKRYWDGDDARTRTEQNDQIAAAERKFLERSDVDWGQIVGELPTTTP